MAEQLAGLVLVGVLALLAASVVQQFRQIGPRAKLLDALALAPQWKFFGQDAVGSDPGWSDDWHILARVAAIGDETAPEPWQPVLSAIPRTWQHAIWNPDGRSCAQLLALAERLGKTDPETPPEPTGLAYLSILRASLEAVSPDARQAVQFALVATRGRQERPVELRYISWWHVP